MALHFSALVDAVVSHALATGRFESCNGHEPTDQPLSGGLTAGVWVTSITPVRSSGLDAVSTQVVLLLRVYTSTQSNEPDLIDPAIVDAIDDLYTAYCGDFTLGGLVREVDIFGQHGPSLQATAGYITQSSSAVSRVMTLTLPLLVNDTWQEGSEG